MEPSPHRRPTRIRPRSPRPWPDRSIRRTPVAIAAVLAGAVLVEVVSLHLDLLLGAGSALTLVPFVVVVLAAWHLRRDEAIVLAAVTVVLGHAMWLTSGATYWGAPSLLDLVSRAVAATGLVVVTTSHRRRSQNVTHAARTDGLTGALSRHGFFERVPLRADGIHVATAGSVLYCDIDGLKGVNDRRGHKAGDDLIRTFADTAREVLREDDLLGRFGGDEFVVFLPHTDDFAAWHVAETLLTELRRSGPTPITVSIGIAHAPAGATLDRVVQHADQAMYDAKRRGGDHARLFHFERPSREHLERLRADADARPPAEARRSPR
jgi:diguanylate cyclase (GGDEF)-like protein